MVMQFADLRFNPENTVAYRDALAKHVGEGLHSNLVASCTDGVRAQLTDAVDQMYGSCCAALVVMDAPCALTTTSAASVAALLYCICAWCCGCCMRHDVCVGGTGWRGGGHCGSRIALLVCSRTRILGNAGGGECRYLAVGSLLPPGVDIHQGRQPTFYFLRSKVGASHQRRHFYHHMRMQTAFIFGIPARIYLGAHHNSIQSVSVAC